MNTAHWHLLLNHFPIISTIIGVLILVAGYLTKAIMVKRTALGVFIFGGLIAIPAFLTGEGAEEVVEDLPGVGKAIIEQHESIASVYLWAILVLGLAALFTLIMEFSKKRNHQKVAAWFYGFTLIIALGCIVLSQQVGNSGGEIRHSEIRSSQSTPPPTGGGQHDDD